MTETKKTVKKSGGTAAKAAKPQRDAYDDFLDLTEGKPAARKSAAGKKQAGAKSTKTAAPAKKKAAAVEAGIVPLEGKSGKTAGTATKSASSKGKAAVKTSSAKGKTAGVTSSTKSVASKGKTSAGSGEKKASAARGTVKTSVGKSGKTGANAPAVRKNPAASRRSAVLYVDNSKGRDPFDDYLDRTQPRTPKKKKKNRQTDGLTIGLLIAIVCVLGLGLWQQTQYQSFQRMRNAVAQQSFYEGTKVEGIDISSMTLQQALDYWRQNVEPAYSGRAVSLSGGQAVTAAEVGYYSDYETVLTNAWGAGRSGSLEERYALISGRKDKPVEYAVNRRLYSDEGVAAYAQAVAAQIDQPAQDAKIESFNMSSYSFVFSEEKSGSKLDAEALAAGIKQALDAGGGSVELSVQTLEPQIRKAEIESLYGGIAQAVTNASSSNNNRLTNIRRSLELINGTRLAPGEVFSFNETVGKRTTERGFKVATAYSSGAVTEEVGGGICQVSTTLFNAAVKADLEIVERHNHSLTVAYVDKGKDAAVNWNSQDLRFKNTTGDDIYIACFLSNDKRVRVGIFGKKIANGEYITVVGEQTGEIDFETVYQLNFAMAPGQQNVVQEGKKGYTAVAYKIRWNADGKQLSKELLCRSTYKSVNKIIEHGP